MTAREVEAPVVRRASVGTRIGDTINRWQRSWIEIRLIYFTRSGLSLTKCTALLESYLAAGGSREDFSRCYDFREDMDDDDDL